MPNIWMDKDICGESKLKGFIRSCQVKQDQAPCFPKLLLMPHLLDLACFRYPTLLEVKINGNGLRNKWKGMEIDEKQKKCITYDKSV